MADHHTLRFSTPQLSSSPHLKIALPEHITRHFIPTPLGTLELLSAQPPSSQSTSSQPRKKALLFLHGGFGSASVWLPFLTYFSQTHLYPSYALSLRGHGASWTPSYLSHVYETTRTVLISDVSIAVSFIHVLETAARSQALTSEDLILIAHSAGGGLAQSFLSHLFHQKKQGDEGGEVGGLVLLASFPNYGGWRVYLNWALLDPWFLLRFLWQGGHSRSPLSSTQLVWRAFFGQGFELERVREFEELMPEYESLVWPIGMLGRFVRVNDVLGGIVGWESGMRKRVLVVAGGEDRLMSVDLMRRMVGEYRRVAKKFIRLDSGGGGRSEEMEGGRDEEMGVGFVVIEGSGHHIQNDVHWELCAKEILAFLEQL